MSDASRAVMRFVAEHRPLARALGKVLVERIDEPEAFIAALRSGLPGLVGPARGRIEDGPRPEARLDLRVRGPLIAAVLRPVRRALDEGSSTSALWLAQRLAQESEAQMRVLALPVLERALEDDPERSWQLMRQLGRGAQDAIEVDDLAGLYAQGILSEPFRWAELEQLIYSQRPMERRLVAATLAMIPRSMPAHRRADLASDLEPKATSLVRSLIGDDDDTVQRALAWAIREWTRARPGSFHELLLDETAIAIEHADGHRARVIRGALAAQPPSVARALRARLAGVRRDRRAPATSIAARQAAGFAALMARADDAVGHQGQRYTRSRS